MSWHIRSNSGSNLVSIEFLEKSYGTDGEAFWVGKVQITGLFWQRHTPRFEGDPIEDFTVVLHQVGFRQTQLQNFLAQLKDWLNKPTRIFAEFTTQPHDSQRLTITIDKSEQLISSEQKPSCTVRYSCSPFQSGQWEFVLDQSCINLLIEELTEALTSEF